MTPLESMRIVDAAALLALPFLISLGLMLAYLALLSVCAAFSRRRYITEPLRYRQFAIVIPAHNEERTIGKTLLSVSSVEYPRRSFDVIVVADNCTDRTAEVAASFGAIVYQRSDLSSRGKGHALRWCFDQLPHTYEAVVVIDADSTMSANFLSVMNYYIEHGAGAIQAADIVEPQRDSWSVEMTRLGFTLYNVVRPLGRKVLHCSPGLRGNGMCFTTSLLREYPWQAYSLTEDLEYGLLLVLNDKRVVFAPEAEVRATMPRNPRNAESQRARWEAGRLPLVRSFAPRLLQGAIQRGSFVHLDVLVDLIIPPFLNIFAFVSLFALITGGFWLSGYSEIAPIMIAWFCLVTLGLIHVFVGLYAARADASMYRALLFAPQYLFWKIGVYARILTRHKNREWVRTTRESHDIPH